VKAGSKIKLFFRYQKLRVVIYIKERGEGVEIKKKKIMSEWMDK
jgi:hypothetical protein